MAQGFRRAGGTFRSSVISCWILAGIDPGGGGVQPAMDYIASLDPLAWVVIIVPIAALAIIFATAVRSARRSVKERDEDESL